MARLAFTAALLLLLVALSTGQEAPVYNYDHGGSDWPGVCTSGGNQSPIDIVTDSVKLGGNRYMKLAHVRSSTMLIKNTNLSVPYSMMIYPTNNDSLLHLSDGTYYLHHMSLHTPANHPVNGMYAPLEVKHAYFHPDNATRKAVVITMFRLDKNGNDNPWLNTILNNIPSKPGNVTVDCDTDFQEVLDLSKGYWYYPGSQIHPPCDESVQWHISRSSSSVSAAQLLRYQNFLADMNHGDRTNNRAVQPADGHVVMEYRYDDSQGGGQSQNQAAVAYSVSSNGDDSSSSNNSDSSNDSHDDDHDDDHDDSHDDDHDDNHDDDHDDSHDDNHDDNDNHDDHEGHDD
ncbi:hypothetical protein CLOP_g23139 [Closterium sp. NIES-67]|nr:hypothetical protein CLOP_g23139 [Closterium sp. NIES-67]